MSNLKERAKEIKAEGVAQRGNFEPEGAPKNVYKYWLKETNTKKGRDIRNGDRRENFCHFWRVVAIWAPLMFMRNKAIDSLPTIGLVAALIAVASLFVAAASVEYVMVLVGMVLAIVVGFTLAVVGICSGIALVLGPVAAAEYAILPKGKWAKIGAVLGAPVALIAASLTKFGQWYLKNTERNNGIVFVSAVSVAVVGFVITLVMGIIAAFQTYSLATIAINVGIFLAIILGCAIAVLAAAMSLMKISEFIQGRRAIMRRRREEAQTKRARAARAFYNEHGHYPYEKPAGPPRKPSKIEKFFSGLADFIILYAQVVRVNKWKICPLVEVDTK